MPKYPFSPEILDALPEELAELFRNLEITLLEEICSRLKIADNLNEVTVQDIRALRALGIDLDDIKKAISETSNVGMDKLNKLLDDVVERNQAYYSELVDLAKLTMPEHFVNAADIDAIRRQTEDEFTNITQSMGFLLTKGGQKVMLPPAKAYQWALDNAEMQIMSGGISYREAIKNAVKQFADSGIKTVDYESGHVDQIDVAVRRAVMTGVNQLCQKYSEQSLEYLQTDLVEVSAHQGARDKGTGPENHKGWQGKVYRWESKNSETKKYIYEDGSLVDDKIAQEYEYPDFIETTGYGTGQGLGGWNCRHHWYSYIEGVSERTYTDEQLANIDPPPFEYQGKTYTAYEATRQQRKIERTIRKLKRERAAYEQAGLTEDAQDVSIRIRRLQAEYKNFSKAAGLPEQRERMAIQYSNDLLDIPRFKSLKQYDGQVSVIGKFSDQQYVVNVGKPKIKGSTLHYTENLMKKTDRKSLTPEAAQAIIESNKLTLYQSKRKTLKFLSDSGYVVLNLNKEIVTAVPEKLRKKYKDYLEGVQNG